MPLLEVKNFKVGGQRDKNRASQNDKVSDLTHEQQKKASEREREREREIRKERANKTARVKWGRGKREANGK